MNKLTEIVTPSRILIATALAGAITAAVLSVRERVKNVPAQAERYRQTLPKDGFEQAGFKVSIPSHK